VAKVNGMNIEVVAGRVKSVDRRTVRDRTLTILRIEGFDFSVLVWEADVADRRSVAKQGDYIFAEGRIQSRSYERDGAKQYVTEIIAYRVTNLSEGKAGNTAFAIGNLGRTPSMRYTSGGKAVTDVSLAATAFGMDHPEWLNLVAWEKVAEIINQYLEKGNRIAVAGRLIRSTWKGTGENEGKTFHRTKFVVNDMLMLGGANGNAGSPADGGPPPMGEEELEDIPF
jgi:single-strand DNA-binding protein